MVMDINIINLAFKSYETFVERYFHSSHILFRVKDVHLIYCVIKFEKTYAERKIFPAKSFQFSV